MLQHLDELKEILKKYSLCVDDVIIVGSGAISEIGGRINNDIEFCVRKKARPKIPFYIRFLLLFVDHYDVSENVDLFANRYLRLGMYDSDIEKKHCFHRLEGTEFYMVNPEYELGYKYFRNWPKDKIDFENIEKDTRIKTRIDYSLFSSIIEKKCSFRNKLYCAFRRRMWKYKEYGEKFLKK